MRLTLRMLALSSNGDNGPALPVLMYHGVGRVMRDWRWWNLTVPASIFHDHMKWLSKCGYRTVGFDELIAHTGGERVFATGERVIVLTFDDGYVDNWTFAAPIMQKFGFHGTILVTPEFVHPEPVVRPTLADVWQGAVGVGELETRGFMSWEELRRASREGVLSVQSHAMTHTWYPVSDRVVDFHHPGDAHYWLDWNAAPEEKPFYLARLGSSRVPYGVPVYEHKKSLEAGRRYYPPGDESEAMAAFVARNGGEAFFANGDWRDRLFAELARMRENGPAGGGRHETDDEHRARLRFELDDARAAIEANIGASVDYHVWPGGGYNDEAMEHALGLFRAVTIGPRDRRGLSNRPGQNPRHIVRRGIPAIENGRGLWNMDGRYLVEFIEEFKGSTVARRRRQVLKTMRLATLALTGWREVNE